MLTAVATTILLNEKQQNFGDKQTVSFYVNNQIALRFPTEQQCKANKWARQ